MKSHELTDAISDLCKSMIRSSSYDSDNISDDEDARLLRRSSFSDDDDDNRMLKCSQLRVSRDIVLNIRVNVYFLF